MKKKSFVLLFVLVCLLVVGCKKKDESNTWVINKSEANIMLSDDVKKVFDDASKAYNGKELKLVALLSEQVVAGKNYMFLCKTEDDGVTAYKVAIVYKDLEGKATITQVNDFDITKYADKEISLNAEQVVGGWNVEIPGKPIMLEEKAQEAFDKATEKIVGVTYYPITVLATKEADGTNYAVLCYGKVSDQYGTTGIYVLTINANKGEVSTIAAVDLKDYNK